MRSTDSLPLTFNFYYANKIYHANRSNIIFDKAVVTFDFSDKNIVSSLLIKNFLDTENDSATLFKNTLMSENNQFNEFGTLFFEWFSDYTANSFIIYYNNYVLLKNNIANIIKSFNQINAALKISDESTLQIDSLIYNLLALDELINHINLMPYAFLSQEEKEWQEDYVKEFAVNYKETLRIIQHACGYLYNLYFLPNDLQPGSITAMLRSHFCNLLNIFTELILEKNQVQKLDETIKEKILTITIHHIDFYIIHKKPKLLILKKTEILQTTYRLPLTPNVLVQCIQYWMTNNNFYYQLTHPNNWFSNDNDFIDKLINLINQYGDKMHDELPDHELRLLKLTIKNEHRDMKSIYELGDIDKEVIAALLRTSSLSSQQYSQLRYAEIAYFLSLDEAIKRNLTSSPTDTFSQEILNVRASQLKRSGWTMIFPMNLSRAERLLLQIQDKHERQPDFFLDDKDIDTLKRLLAARWREKCNYHIESAEEVAFKTYCFNPSRHDRVYIALSEILAIHYRSNHHDILNHELLMPGNSHFLSANQLVTTKLPESIASLIYVYDEDETPHISVIPLKDLLTLPSGYALDFNWILFDYQTNRKLDHPYTDQPFSNEDILYICQHQLAAPLLNCVAKNFHTGITQRALKLLVNYLNGVIFDNGFTGYYSSKQNSAVVKAYGRFVEEMNKLDITERSSLLAEPIPGSSHDTVETILDKSRGTCLTYRGISLAKVVLAYEPINHGLQSAILVEKALEDGHIHHRKYNSTSHDRSEQETFILEFMQNNNELTERMRYIR